MVLSEVGDEAEGGQRGGDRFVNVRMHEGSMNDAESPPKIRHEKVRKMKVRSGCKSCRTRRLKCDEGKPSCHRCLTGGFECEPVNPSHTRTAPTLARKAISFELSRYCANVTLPFQDDTEARYFAIFQEETSVELSGVFASSFWNQIVLQESHQQPFIRHAVVSIAALNRAVKSRNPLPARHGFPVVRNDHEAARHREYALQEYGKALRAMRGISWQEERHLRMVLIATLLVIVFEVLVAQPDLAFTHALIGDRLICHWLHNHPHRLPHTSGLQSPLSAIVEDELLMTFGRFDTQLLSFVDHRAVSLHREGRSTCQYTVDRMPTLFSDIREASAYWQVVMRRAGHFIFSAKATTQSSKLEAPFQETIAGRALEMNAATCIYTSPYLVPDSLEHEKSIWVGDVERWTAAFSFLWEQLHREVSSTDAHTLVAASILRMYSLSTRILVEGTTFTSEVAYDTFLPLFQEIVVLARFIDDNLPPSYHFHLSTGPPLFATLLRCRDARVRRDALAILYATTVDGPWDRHMIAKAGEWMMRVEEEGSDNGGYIEERRRVRLTRLVMGMQEKKIFIQCVRRITRDGPPPPPPPRFEWIETGITEW